MDGNSNTILNLDEMLAGYDRAAATARYGEPEQALEVAKVTARALANFLDYGGLFEGLDQPALDVIIDAVTDIESTVITTGFLAAVGLPEGPLLRRLRARVEGAEAHDDESGQAPAPATDDAAAIQSAEGGQAPDAGDSPR